MPNGHGYTSGCQQEPVSIFKGSRPSLMGASWRVVTRRVGNRAPRPHDVLQSGFAHFATGGHRWPPADPYSASPGLAAPRARLTHQDGPLVGRPPNDQSMAVGAVAEGVRLVAIAFEVFPGVGDQFLDVLLGVAGSRIAFIASSISLSASCCVAMTPPAHDCGRKRGPPVTPAMGSASRSRSPVSRGPDPCLTVSARDVDGAISAVSAATVSRSYASWSPSMMNARHAADERAAYSLRRR